MPAAAAANVATTPMTVPFRDIQNTPGSEPDRDWSVQRADVSGSKKKGAVPRKRIGALQNRLRAALCTSAFLRHGIGRRGRALALCELRLELLVIEIGDVNPRVTHFIDRPIAPADPLVGIRVRAIVGGVVPPRHEMKDRALRQQWCGVV